MRLPQFPYRLELLGEAVTIYRHRHGRRGLKQYWSFRLDYRLNDGRGRQRKTFADFEKAKRHGESVLLAILNEEFSKLNLQKAHLRIIYLKFQHQRLVEFVKQFSELHPSSQLAIEAKTFLAEIKKVIE